MTTENWYLKNKTRIVREVKFAIPHYKKFLAEAYGMDVAEAVCSEAVQRFEALLPDIPYVGGDENTRTEDRYLLFMVPALAIVLALLGLETLSTNLPGWLLFLSAIVI